MKRATRLSRVKKRKRKGRVTKGVNIFSKFFGDIELEEFEKERRREIEYVPVLPSATSKKPKRRLIHNYRTRATREAQLQQVEVQEILLSDFTFSNYFYLFRVGGTVLNIWCVHYLYPI